MAKLHELLAVSTNLENQSNKTRADLMATFEKKRHLFGRKIVTFKSNEEGKEPVTEEQSDIQSTIRKEMKWISGILAKDMDVGHQIDIANTLAKADVVIEDTGEILLKDVPATSLLQLEKHLKKLHELLVAVPTLDPAKGFAVDADHEAGIYKAREVTKTRTKKATVPIVLYDATKEHPAQAQLVSEDVPTGTIHEQEWSALLTPALKGDLIERNEMLLRAVKRARSRANESELDVASHKIGKRLLEWVMVPLEPPQA